MQGNGNNPAPIVEARALEKFYTQPDGAKIQVIAPTDLAVYPGQIVGLLGPSGCGKSTLLRMLTGLAKPSGGQVLWHGQPVDGQVPNVSIVFQSFALFPWLTVLENVEAPLEARGMPAIERHKRALRIIDAVGLDGFESATDLKEAARVFRFTRWERWRRLILPGIFPYLVTGLVTASGGAWNASIIAEYFHFRGETLSTRGLGSTIGRASDSGQFALLLAATLLMAGIVVVINRLVWRWLYRLAATRYRLET